MKAKSPADRKPEPSRSESKALETRHAEQKHLYGKAAETHIHDPDADRTLLERWLRKMAAKGLNYWLTAAIVVLAVLLAAQWGSRFFNQRDESAAKAWTALFLTTSPDDLPKAAEAFGTSTAGAWAHYQAGTARYQEGMRNIPANREAAKPFLNQAFDEYKTAADSAGDDTYLKRISTLGMARALEARNELTESAEMYEQISTDWPDTEEAKFAAKRAQQLRSPEAQSFYAQLYSFKVPDFGLPPRSGDSGATGVSPGSMPDLPPRRSSSPTAPGAPGTPTGSSDLPDVFAKPGTSDPPITPPSESPSKAEAPEATPPAKTDSPAPASPKADSRPEADPNSKPAADPAK
jgi:hypothetical protein